MAAAIRLSLNNFTSRTLSGERCLDQAAGPGATGSGRTRGARPVHLGSGLICAAAPSPVMTPIKQASVSFSMCTSPAQARSDYDLHQAGMQSYASRTLFPRRLGAKVG